MNQLCCFWLFSTWLLLWLTVCTFRAATVKVIAGQNVTLPCTYNSKYHGKCEICWMKGDIPSTGCGDEIIATNGDLVVRTKSARYQLNGNIQRGNVSLTIIATQTSDSGKYGCRIHIPGLFNDQKTVVQLDIMKEPLRTPATTTTPTTPTTPTTQVTSLLPRVSGVTTGRWDSETTQADNFSQSPVEFNKHEDNGTEDILPAIIVSVLLLLLVWGAVAFYLMWKQKRKRRAALEIARLSQSSVIYSNTDNSLGLSNRAMVVENIYQIDPENEYEQWS